MRIDRSVIDQLVKDRVAIIEGVQMAELMAEKCRLDRELFALPNILDYRGTMWTSGYLPEGKEYQNSPRPPDKKRIWQMYREDEKWPEIPGLKENAREVFRRYEALSRDCARAIEEYFTIPDNKLLSLTEGGEHMLRSNYYPPVDTFVAEEYGTYRNSVHNDMGIMTLMYTPSAGGFEVYTEGGGWKTITAPDDSVILITGKLFLLLTNGTVPPAWHRVVDAPGERFSHPFFVHARSNDVLSPLPPFDSVNVDDPTPKMTEGEFIKAIRENTDGMREWVDRHSEVPPNRRQ